MFHHHDRRFFKHWDSISREKEKRKEEKNLLRKKEEKRRKELDKIKALSFDPDEDVEEGEEEDEQTMEEDEDAQETAGRKRFGMNPEVDTSFLPDRDRDEQVRKTNHGR